MIFSTGHCRDQLNMNKYLAESCEYSKSHTLLNIKVGPSEMLSQVYIYPWSNILFSFAIRYTYNQYFFYVNIFRLIPFE